MIDKKDITGIILAGGKSSRMGKEKGLINFNGKPFVQYIISALRPLVSKTLIISGNSDYDVFKLERFEDIIKDAGPLAGIYTGLIQSKTDFNLVLSCDIPLIRTEVLELLIKAQDGKSDVFQIVGNGKHMPLIALYHRRCERIFYELLQNDERRLYVALNQCKVKNVVLNSEKDLLTTNINTPEELKTIAHGSNN
ncbi:molybdenum cofactor guanylyltransferase [Salinimicrobium flavum]|uniref:Probable molybdenum cofactor guanylyltransferase n=1 Tax=Salinimicrobium flavum TaxID=1737065 RepID=A0ABW5IUX7_9FLAO